MQTSRLLVESVAMLAASLGLAEAGEPVTAARLVARFDPEHLPREPWVFAVGG